MHALNALWLLRELNCNSDVEVIVTRTKYCDSIEIKAETFEFVIEENGACLLKHNGDINHQCDINYWKLVKQWTKEYMSEVL